MMSQENVKIVASDAPSDVTRYHRAGDDLDDSLDEFFDPEIKWHDVPVLPNAGVHFGRDAFRRHVTDYLETFSESSFEIELH